MTMMMMMKAKFPVSLLHVPMLVGLLLLAATSCAGQFVVPEQPPMPTTSTSRPVEPDVVAVNYTHEGYALQGFKATPDMADSNPVPAIIIIPDWDGVNYYEQQRATLIAQDLMYVAFAADIYGADLQYDVANNMTYRRELADYYRSNATLFTERIQAAINVVKLMDDVDPDHVALIGYCFGGTGVLQYAMTLGDASGDEVNAVVSFHGGLTFILEANSTGDDETTNVTTKVLVLSGGEDDASSEIIDLELALDARGADWEITRYSNIDHAFTVFDDERYNEWADLRSWDSMVTFLQEALGLQAFESSGPPAAINVEPVVYTDEVDGTVLQSYISMPSTNAWQRPLPVVIIIPDWDGNNEYEQERATLLAEQGYIGFAADIYGADLQSNLTTDQRIELAGMYRDNSTLFVQRMVRALHEVKTNPLWENDVDVDNIAVIGYCLGGTGTIQLAFSGNNETKVVASFHGGHAGPALPVASQNVTPYTLVLSGGDDDAHGNQTELEAALNAANADWEITRYSGVVHGFTKWDSVDAYSLKADYRSWESMMTAFEELMPIPVALLDVDSPLSDSPSSVPSQSPAPAGPTILPMSGAPSSIPTIMPNIAPIPELQQPTAMPIATAEPSSPPVPTSSGRHTASYQSFIATASLSLCILWTVFS